MTPLLAEAPGVVGPSPLACDLQSQLSRNPHLRRRMLQVEEHDGAVVIRGEVESYYQKLMVQEMVRRHDGVGEIDNQLSVHWQ